LALEPEQSFVGGQLVEKVMLVFAAQATLQVLLPAALHMQVQPLGEGALSTMAEPPAHTGPPPTGAVPAGHTQLPCWESAHD
jgi:hypothetical protein